MRDKIDKTKPNGVFHLIPGVAKSKFQLKQGREHLLVLEFQLGKSVGLMLGVNQGGTAPKMSMGCKNNNKKQCREGFRLHTCSQKSEFNEMLCS